MITAMIADFAMSRKLLGIEALHHRPLRKGQALLVQHPSSPVTFDQPAARADAGEVAAAKAAQRAERAANDLCELCGWPRSMHCDAAGVVLLGCLPEEERH